MRIPEKFKINTKDFKIYFDNNKKTHVCENLTTGEKTNIGVLGILMQMGILKSIEDKATEEKIVSLSEKISNLEAKINDVLKNVGSVSEPEVEETPKEEEVEEERPEEIVEEPKEEKPKSEMNERIMKKVLEQSKEEPVEETEEEPAEDVEVESDEEIENWMKV